MCFRKDRPETAQKRDGGVGQGRPLPVEGLEGPRQCGSRYMGPTLTRRMAEVARMAGPIRALPGDQDSKARLPKAKMLPAALYGVETSFAADAGLRKLRGFVFSVLRSRCEMGGNAAHLFVESCHPRARARP